jgi:hypothetical protein
MGSASVNSRYSCSTEAPCWPFALIVSPWVG